MKISYKLEQGIDHSPRHPQLVFEPVPIDDDELVQEPVREDPNWLQEGIDPEAVREFWTDVVDDLRAKGELGKYEDDADDAYQEDPAYK